MSAGVASAIPLVTDEQLAHLAPLGLIAIAVLFVLAFCWADRGRPWPVDEEPDPAPPTAPDITSLEALRRASDRG